MLEEVVSIMCCGLFVINVDIFIRFMNHLSEEVLVHEVISQVDLDTLDKSWLFIFNIVSALIKLTLI